MNPAILSKINWTQVVGFAAMMFAIFGIEVDPATQLKAVAAIAATVQFITIIWRTFFTMPPV